MRELEKPFPVARSQVLEAQLAARRRDADLPAVEVAGENDVELTRPQRLHRVREVDEQDAEVGLGIGEPAVKLAMPQWVPAGHLHFPAAHVKYLGLVIEQHRGGDAAQVGRAAERVAGRRDIVISEHRVGPEAGPEPGELALEHAQPAAAADEVAGDGDEIEIPLGPQAIASAGSGR